MENCQNLQSTNSLQNSQPRRSRGNPGNWGRPGTFRPISAEEVPSFTLGLPSLNASQLSDSIHYPHLFPSSQDVRLDQSSTCSSRTRSKPFHRRRKFHNRVNDSAASDLGACGGGESITSEASSSNHHHHYQQHQRQHRKDRRYREESVQEQPSSLPTEETLKHKLHNQRNRNEQRSNNQEGGTDSIPKRDRAYKKHSRYYSRNMPNSEKPSQAAAPSAPFVDDIDPKQEAREDGYTEKGSHNNLQWTHQVDPLSAPPTNRQPHKKLSERLFEKFKTRPHERYHKHKGHSKFAPVPDVNYNEDDATQRERLTEQLKRGDYECMVCCEQVWTKDRVWNCPNCFNIFHLGCTYKWAKTLVSAPNNNNGQSIWRCPACQHQYDRLPEYYMCFCGKVRHPEYDRNLVPHSCGNICGRLRNEDCPHPCTLPCHPGPCPECPVQLTRRCPCGKTNLTIRCSTTESASCGQACDKLLDCNSHRCDLACHTGECPPCSQILSQKCYCGRDQRKVGCNAETSMQESYSCGQPCDHSLGCEGDHHCEEPCHPPPCQPCARLPSLVSTCPCGKVPLSHLSSPPRQACTEPIPTCSNTCGRPLPCNPSKAEVHSCQSPCHEGPCPPCSLKSVVKCRCGGTSTSVPCQELATTPVPVCERKCKQRKSCGSHRCQQVCCTDTEHLCDLTCNKKLTCGHHTCQMPCHLGKCPPCPNVSFNDLPCHCGKTLRLAPIPCGAPPLECKEICTREHPCSHPVTHQCHNDPECPPCPALTEKWCFGKHEIRGNVPCFIDGISCGKPCGKPLPCGRHTCQQLCHSGPCDPSCSQPCPEPRPDCKHPCGTPCHQGPCPRDTSCKVKVLLSCACGHRNETVPCGATSDKRPTLSILSSKMQNLHLGQTVDVSELLAAIKNNAKLECNEECAVLERNRRLAEALQIDPVEHRPPQPNYSEFLKEEARKNPEFVKYVYDAIHNLVTQSKQSKLKTQSFSFPSMKKAHRHIVHEVAEAFTCQTQAFDLEPNRNVVVTAVKHLSTIPTCSIMTVVQQEAGLRKVPTPINSLEISTTKDKPPPIDYFDYDV